MKNNVVENNLLNDENKDISDSNISYENVFNILVKLKFNTAGYQVRIPLEKLLPILRRTLYFIDLNEYKFNSHIYVPKYYNIDLYGYKGDNYSDSETMIKWFEINKNKLKYNLSRVYLFSNMIVGYITVNSRSLKIILAILEKNDKTLTKKKIEKKLLFRENDFGNCINLYKGKKYDISSLQIILNGALRCNLTE